MGILIKIIELFSGTESFSKVARSRGHRTFTVDWDPQFKPDLVFDVGNLCPCDFPNEFQNPDIIWASPPCQKFSILTFTKNWKKKGKRYIPRNLESRDAIELVRKTIALIELMNPRFYFIENPVGMLRKMPEMRFRYKKTVTYCKYGEFRRKPTDIWTNSKFWKPKPMCKRNSMCHEKSPRHENIKPGSGKGNLGSKHLSAIDSARIPEPLCLEIILSCENTNGSRLPGKWF